MLKSSDTILINLTWVLQFFFFFFFLQSISEEMMVSFKSLGFSRVQRNRNMTDPLRNDDPGETNDIFQLNYSQM